MFVNCQFPNKKIPFACWDNKPLVIKAVWKLLYIYHYDMFDEKYYTAMRIGLFVVLAYGIFLKYNIS
jgi:hypothetical protein